MDVVSEDAADSNMSCPENDHRALLEHDDFNLFILYFQFLKSFHIDPF